MENFNKNFHSSILQTKWGSYCQCNIYYKNIKSFIWKISTKIFCPVLYKQNEVFTIYFEIGVHVILDDGVFRILF